MYSNPNEDDLNLQELEQMDIEPFINRNDEEKYNRIRQILQTYNPDTEINRIFIQVMIEEGGFDAREVERLIREAPNFVERNFYIYEGSYTQPQQPHLYDDIESLSSLEDEELTENIVRANRVRRPVYGIGLTPEEDWEEPDDNDIRGSGFYKHLYKTALRGGKLSASHLKGLLSASYSKKPKSYLEYEVDKELSGQRTQVYKNPKTGQVVVSHRGTKGIHDIGNDLKYALGFDLKNTKRFKHAQDIQRKAEEKYGAKNISTIGHSLGSKLARDVGKHSKEVIELNPAYNIPDIMKKKSDNTYSIRTKYDPVSFLVPLKKDKHITTIKSKSLNPLAEHTVDVLDRIDPNTEIGAGLIGAGLKKKKLKELKQIAKSLPKKQRIKLTKIKKGELVKHLCSCGGYE